MMRPNIKFNDDVAAVIKFHCTRSGITMAKYIEQLVLQDLFCKYPELMKETKKETVTR